MEQLFLNGPTWDGNLISKTGRDELRSLGYIDTYEGGWQWLSHPGTVVAINLSGVSRRWQQKQSKN